MDIPKEGVIVHLKDLGQTSKDRDADAVGTAFDLRVDAPGDVEIHKLQFGNHLVLRQFPLHTEGADGFANLNILFQFFLNFQPKVALTASWAGNLHLHSPLDLLFSHPNIMFFHVFNCRL